MGGIQLNKEIFEIIQQFHSIETDLYFQLEKKLGVDEAEELLDGFTDYREKLLKIGKYLDEEAVLNRDAVLNSKYNGFPKYLKLNILYEYENGFSLCETTTGLIELIPSELLTS